MSNYRRSRVPGASYFFTVVTHARCRFLTDVPARWLLGSLLRRCRLRSPFILDAILLLPDHLHAIGTLPPGNADYSARWGWIKQEFTSWYLKLGGRETGVSAGRRKERRRGVWQPRFWEQTLETIEDFDRHFDDLHYNPVKHGLVKRPRDWPWSNSHRWVHRGVYPQDWACGRHGPPPGIDEMDDTVGEP